MRRPTSPAESTDYRQRRGFRGEQQVRRWLESQGWCIEAHRYRVGREEIDLVARRRELVAFIEVKTRRSVAHGSPMEAVHWKKRRAIGRVAAVWALRFGRWGDTYRFDVAEVFEAADGGLAVNHVAAAWRLLGGHGMAGIQVLTMWPKRRHKDTIDFGYCSVIHWL